MPRAFRLMLAIHLQFSLLAHAYKLFPAGSKYERNLPAPNLNEPRNHLLDVHH